MNKEAEYEEARLELEKLNSVMQRRSATAERRPEGDDEQPGFSSPVRKTADADIIESLERQKFRLLSETAKYKRQLADVTGKVADARARMEARREKLSKYNALFLRMGPDAAAKAPRQRMGAASAVVETQAIIQRELARVHREGEVIANKLNRARERSAQLRASIDDQRKDALHFRKLFVRMACELEGLKDSLAQTQAAIEASYEARDRTHEDMRQLAKQFEVDKLEREQEWAVCTAAIEAANVKGGPERVEVASGLLTQQEEDELRRKIKKGQQKMEKDRAQLQLAQAKLAVYTGALSSIKEATGVDDLETLVQTFDRFEDAKYAKVRAASRLVGELETLQAGVEASATSVAAAEDSAHRARSDREARISALQREAEATEAAAAAEREGVVSSLAEIKALCPLIEFAFRAVGADTAFDPAGHVIESEELRQAQEDTQRATGGGSGGDDGDVAMEGRERASGYHTPALTIGEEDEEEDNEDEEKRREASRESSRPKLAILARKPPSPGPAAGEGRFATPAGLDRALLTTGALASAAGTPNPGAAGATSAIFSPSHSRARRGSTGSQTMEMYSHAPGLIHDVAAGITPQTLPRFLGIMEHRAADVMHAYAAHVTDIADTAAEEAAAAAAQAAARQSSPNSAAHSGMFLLNHSSSIMSTVGGFGLADDAASVSSGQGGEGGQMSAGRGGRAAAIAEEKRVVAEEARGVALAAVAALGPPQPPGRTKEALAASTLMTSILVDQTKVNAMVEAQQANGTTARRRGVGTPGSGSAREGAITPLGYSADGRRPITASSALDLGAGEDVRPLSLGELRAQAAALTSEAQYKAIRSAAKVAVTVLARSTGESGSGEAW